jgi:hypothetical protein
MLKTHGNHPIEMKGTGQVKIVVVEIKLLGYYVCLRLVVARGPLRV